MPRLFPLAAAVVLATAPAVARSQAPAAPAALTIGSPAPKIAVAEWVKGKPVTLGDGKRHVVEFWATWCPPCRESIPHLTELAKKYAGKVDFTGVSVSEHGLNVPGQVKAFVAKMGDKMDYHVARDDAGGTMNRTWMDAAGQDGIPTVFVVDKDGTIAWIGHPMGGLDEALVRMIAGKYDKTEAAAAMKSDQTERAQEAAQKAKQDALVAKMDALYSGAMSLAQARKFPEAVAEMDKVSAAHPDFTRYASFVRYSLLLKYDEAAAQHFAAKQAATEWKTNVHAQTLSSIAWGIVAPDTKIKKPDYAAAVIIAEAAVAASEEQEASKEQNAAALDTLSVAYEKNGSVDKALAAEQKALALVPDAASKDREAYAQRVALLKAKLK